MEFFMSGEIDAKVGDAEHIARNKIYSVLSGLVENAKLNFDINRWSFISIILSDLFISDYPEVAKFHKKTKVLEFRLQIPFEKFIGANPKVQISMILDAIERSIGLMEKFKIPENDRQTLKAAVTQARTELLGH